jgi:hypothetical protein
MDAGSLIAATSNVTSDDEFDEYISGISSLPPQIIPLLKDLVAHMGNEIDVSLTHSAVGARVRVIGTGLNLVVKNALKYLPQ